MAGDDSLQCVRLSEDVQIDISILDKSAREWKGWEKRRHNKEQYHSSSSYSPWKTLKDEIVYQFQRNFVGAAPGCEVRRGTS
jgi:hypothetical protein